MWSAWTPFTFTLESSAAVTPTVSQFGLESVTGAAGGGLKTANPRVMGQVSGPSSLSGLTVQFDYGNGVVVGTATTDANGQFYYDPSPLPYGAVTIRACAEMWNETSGSYLVGAWTPLSFTYEQETPVAATLTSMGLASGTNGTASDPTLTGQVVSQTEPENVAVQFHIPQRPGARPERLGERVRDVFLPIAGTVLRPGDGRGAHRESEPRLGPAAL